MGKRKPKQEASGLESELAVQTRPPHQVVEAARMEHGWDGRPEGDIHGSYSADRISEGKPIRKPFPWQGGQWVCVGISNKEVNAYRLTPLGAFKGVPTTYAKKTGGLAEAARNDPNGFYHGMTIKCAGSTYVLTGPELTFIAGEVGQATMDAGTADPARLSKLDAERVSLEYRQRSTKRADTGREPIEESPLFGGSAQGRLFGEE